MTRFKKGDVILNREMTTQAGRLTADKGTQLMSVFLGAVRENDEPDPASRIESLGWRQMSLFECTVVMSQGVEDTEWRLSYSCLGAVDAVEAAVRFANMMIAEEFEHSEEGDPPPLLAELTVGTVEVGPIDRDGRPFDGRGPAFFHWNHNAEVTLDEHLDALRKQAQLHAQ